MIDGTASLLVYCVVLGWCCTFVYILIIIILLFNCTDVLNLLYIIMHIMYLTYFQCTKLLHVATGMFVPLFNTSYLIIIIVNKTDECKDIICTLNLFSQKDHPKWMWHALLSFALMYFRVRELAIANWDICEVCNKLFI